MADTPLTEALAYFQIKERRRLNYWQKGGTGFVSSLAPLLDAARKWAELEALVADGGRVVVEIPCEDGKVTPHDGVWPCWEKISHLPHPQHCDGGTRSVILGAVEVEVGEGAE